MRSTGFVALSIILHMLCIVALAMTPIRTISPEKAGETIEVKMGEPADKAGVATAEPAKEESKAQAPEAQVAKVEPPKAEPVKPAPAPLPPEPPVVKKVAPVKVAVAKPAKVNKPVAVKKSKPAPVATAVDEKAPVTEDESAPAIVKTEEPKPAVTEEATKPEPKEILIPVKEKAPGGVQAATDDQTEAKSEDVQKTVDPSPVAVASGESKEAGNLVKGGASKEGAVSYLDLRQLPGNKAPIYPMQARLDKRQGQLELIYRVTKEGKVSDIQVTRSSGFKDLDGEAVRAITLFKFVPGQEGWARHPVSFTLKGQIVSLPSQLRGKGAQTD